MTSTDVVRAPSATLAALPISGDQSTWTDQERALVEAAGLVRVVNKNTGGKALAERPVVEAFLLHCRRTGLDPIARQIYCIYRGGKWQTQVSIDGARLVAERSGQYEGQTDPEWSDDGRTWFDAWVTTDEHEAHPRFARIGVYRRGFREPLRVVARWESYAVYQDEWAGGSKTGNVVLSAMWAKMPDLMLAKVAEMLALRKAFPQDLSGLYSAEEMAQADTRPRTGGALQHAHAATDYALQPGVIPPAQSEAIATPKVTRDWPAEAAAITDLGELTKLAEAAQEAGELGLSVSVVDSKVFDGARTVMDVLKVMKAELEAQPEPLIEVPKARPVKRQWLSEAKAAESVDALRAVWQEASAGGASAELLEEIEALWASLPDAPKEEVPGEGWATADEVSSPSWDDVVGSSDAPMALGGDES